MCGGRREGVEEDPKWPYDIEVHKNIQNLFPLQNHLAQVLEICYVAKPSDPLLGLFKQRSQGPK